MGGATRRESRADVPAISMSKLKRCGTKKALYCYEKKKKKTWTRPVLLVRQGLEGSSVCPRQSTVSNGFGGTSFNKMFDDMSPSNSGRASGFGESFKILFRYVF